MTERAVAILSPSWADPLSEAAFVARAVAGAVSRAHPVKVLTSGPAGSVPDGAFEIESRPLLDHGDLEGSALVIAEPTAEIPTSTVPTMVLGTPPLDLGPLAPHAPGIGMHVPISAVASARRHNALGETGYVLILTDRRAGPSAAPTPDAAWLFGALAREHVVVVEDAVASIYRLRSLQGRFGVDSRMDLWRLVAFAGVVVDLAPGPLLARECLEAARFGIPVVAKKSPAVERLATVIALSTFETAAELIDAVDLRFGQSAPPTTQLESSYGDPTGFVDRVAALLAEALG